MLGPMHKDRSMTMTRRIHLLAGVLSTVSLAGGLGPAAADGRGAASDGSYRVAQVQPEQKAGKPETEEEKAKRKKRAQGAQDPSAPQPGHRKGQQAKPPHAKAPEGSAKERGEPRRRSFGQTEAQPPVGLPPKAVPHPGRKPAEQAQPRPKQPAQAMPQPHGRAAHPVLRQAEPKHPVPPRNPPAQVRRPLGPVSPQQAQQGAVPSATAPTSQHAVAQPQPSATPDAARDRRERLKQLREERAKGRQEVREERAKAKQELREERAQLHDQASEQRRQWRERLRESRERRREAREKARQELHEVREERRDQVQNQRAGHLERRLQRLEDLQQQRRERVEADGQRTIIEEPDRRVIIRDRGRVIIRHDESERFRRMRDWRTERRDDGTTVTVYSRPDGAEIVSVVDSEGRLLRRARRTREGREIVIIDNRRHHHHHHGRGGGLLDVVVNLPAPVLTIPRQKYIVDYASASDEDVYEALSAPPIERLDRAYSLDEIRHSYHLRERMRRVDLDAINFEFGSWEVTPDQYDKLERVAAAMKSVLARNPDEVFLIEGHTDAVGSDVDNLSLSDRRAESVAVILSETFEVPPENLTTQGYGEEHLKIETLDAERANRRVAVRRITPLLAPPAG
jgi:outer membrane protein OmpA-like peptidoglycan-associated protein